MTAEQLIGVLATLGDLRNQLTVVTAERDRFAAEVVRLTTSQAQEEHPESAK